MNLKHFFLCSWRAHKYSKRLLQGPHTVDVPMPYCLRCGHWNPYMAMHERPTIELRTDSTYGIATRELVKLHEAPPLTNKPLSPEDEANTIEALRVIDKIN